LLIDESGVLPGLMALLLIPVFATGSLANVNCRDADLTGLANVVYVSPEGTDGRNCGKDTVSACKTIQQGIMNCAGEGCGVLVRYGLYNLSTPVDLVDGISLYGSCIFDETTYKYRSTIIGRPAIRANGINKPTTVHGFVILGGSAVAEPGQASIEMTVSRSNGLILSHNTIASGQGGPGSNGTFANGGPGEDGHRTTEMGGGTGGTACPASPPTDDSGKGGKGADYNQVHSSGCFLQCNCSDGNPNQSVGKEGNSSGDVKGGSGGGRGAKGCSCVGGSDGSGDGPPGLNGSPGTCGTKGGQWSENNKGSFHETTWKASNGLSGDTGQVGSGGGGGGSGGYATYLYIGTRGLTGVVDLAGGPGGGGGGGGCGGPGGKGGQQGGASIPLVLFGSSLTIVPNTNLLIPGPGGVGGDGARGGIGGSGGTGADGRIVKKHTSELCHGSSPGNGGSGGGGGNGGAGAGGAGGNGGPSFGIALVNSPPLQANGITIYPAQPGVGGVKGSGGQNNASQCKAPDGRDGVAGFADNSTSILTFNSVTQPEGGHQ
jgi:hypothetical protein